MTATHVLRAAIGVFAMGLPLCSGAMGQVRFVEASEVEAWEDDARVLDVRALSDYLAGHLPGAVHVDDGALRASRNGVPAALHEPEALASIFGRAGVDLDERVLVYASREDPLSATMVAYALTKIGHDDVTILSGGYSVWAANREVTRAYPAIEETEIEVREPTLGAIAFEEFEETVGTDALVFLDARPREHYIGDVPTWQCNGHIPGAHSLHWRTITDPDNAHRLLPADEIEDRLSALGVSKWDDVVAYCGTGREATLLMIALSCELGYQSVRLYEGSWTEYCSTGAPVEVGERVEPTTRVFRDGDISISGQPTEATLRALAAEGVTTVVSTRTGIEMAHLSFDESALLDELGVSYAHVPMGGHDGYTPSQVEVFARIVEASDGPVHLHCASGGRARLLWMAYLVEYEGVTPEEAWRRSESMGGEAWNFQLLLGRPVRMNADG